MNLNITKVYTTIECCSCGVDIAMSNAMMSSVKETKKTFYCINGHGQSYTKSTSDELRDTITKKNNEINRLESEVRTLKTKKTRGRPRK